MHDKLTPKVGVARVTWPKFKIWHPSITFEWIKLRTPIKLYIAWSPLSKYENLTPKWAWLRSRDHFRNFRTPLEWLKVETSYLVHALTMTCTSQYTTNWPLKWAWSGGEPGLAGCPLILILHLFLPFPGLCILLGQA